LLNVPVQVVSRITMPFKATRPPGDAPRSIPLTPENYFLADEPAKAVARPNEMSMPPET
jgi:hypothetical protein